MLFYSSNFRVERMKNKTTPGEKQQVPQKCFMIRHHSVRIMCFCFNLTDELAYRCVPFYHAGLLRNVLLWLSMKKTQYLVLLENHPGSSISKKLKLFNKLIIKNNT